MSNPWLEIPLSDYEGHMNTPNVEQLAVLSDLFGDALLRTRPESVAILGVAGGNGLDRIDSSITNRIVGIDINPLYLDAVWKRHSKRVGIELHCLDLKEPLPELEPVELVYAALLFEHAGAGQCLDNAVKLVAPGGTFATVLQLPASTEQNVSATGFPSMQKLAEDFALVDPDWLCGALRARGFQCQHHAQNVLPGGKAFWSGLFYRS